MMDGLTKRDVANHDRRNSSSYPLGGKVNELFKSEQNETAPPGQA
jgi:hypothetical protein